MKISVIVPAYNEEAWLPNTLDAIQASSEALRSSTGVSIETIVVDNNSTDDTASVAAGRGAKVVHEPVRGIARARNTGALHATGDVLVFIDADVVIPAELLARIQEEMADEACVGGGVDVHYRPKRLIIRAYLGGWRLLARLSGMVQGATQFCRRETFEATGGYDETAWIGEDVDFYWAMERHARSTGGKARLVRHPRVYASSRRFDQWPVWKTLVWTNPLFIALFRRRKSVWGGWYNSPVR